MSYRAAARGLIILAVIFTAGCANAQSEQPRQSARSNNSQQQQNITTATNKDSPDHQRGTEAMPLAVKILATPPDNPETTEQKKQRETKEANEKRLTEATEAIANFTYGLEIASFIAAFIGIGQLFVFFRQLNLMGESLTDAENAAKTAADAANAAWINAENVRIGQRAYVVGGGPAYSIDRKYTGNQFVEFRSNPVFMDIENRGKTPAFVKTIYWGHCPETEFLPYKDMLVSDIIKRKLLNFIVEKGAEDVYPTGKHLRVKQVEFNHVEGEIFFAMIEYEDIFRTPHYSTFKLRLLKNFDSEQLPGCYSDWS